MSETLVKGVDLIKNGEIVAFPTETVYGLGADATNDSACRKIYAAKGRPINNPLIVHCCSIEQAEEFAVFNDIAYDVAEKFCGGPISLVLPLKKGANISKVVTAGLETVCIRIPKNDIAISLIEGSGVPIAAPSANISNYISSTEYRHVKKQLPDVHVIDGGSCAFGLESTILDLSSDIPRILRHGFITASTIANAIGTIANNDNEGSKILAPGMLKKHYSPKTKIRINANSGDSNTVVLNYENSRLYGAFSLNLSRTGDLIEAAGNLYKMLIALDEYAIQHDIDYISVACIPNEGIGIAINDRLTKAAAP